MDVKVTDAGVFILSTNDSGETVSLTLEQYKAKLADKLLATIPDLDQFRETWIEPTARHALINKLPDSGSSPSVIRAFSGMEDYDLYDVIGEIGYGLLARTRTERANAFEYKNSDWLESLDGKAAAVVRAIASQFAKGGIEGLESIQIFKTQEVMSAGGITAIQKIGEPKATIHETKLRMFSV